MIGIITGVRTGSLPRGGETDARRTRERKMRSGCRRENSKARADGAAHAIMSRFAETWTHRWWLPAPVADMRDKVRGRATGRDEWGRGGWMLLDDTKPDARYPRSPVNPSSRTRGLFTRKHVCMCGAWHACMHTCVRMVLTGIVIFLKVARRRTLDDRVIQVHVRRRLVLRRERHLHCIISARGSPCMHINM